MARGNAAGLAKAREAKRHNEEMLAQVLAGVRDLSERMGALDARVKRVEVQQPHFVPMHPDEPIADQRPRKVPKLRAGEQAEGELARMPMTAKGWKATRRPTFQDGQMVRIRPDVNKDGDPENKLWGEILASRNCDGVGEVIRVGMQSDDTGYFKYFVHVPGLTHRQFPEGLRDFELEAV